MKRIQRNIVTQFLKTLGDVVEKVSIYCQYVGQMQLEDDVDVMKKQCHFPTWKNMRSLMKS